jgi:hypothetical protein
MALYSEGKGKVIQHEVIKGCGSLAPFIISTLDGGDWSASFPCHFTPGGYSPHSTHCIGGWVGSRAGLKSMEERKFAPARNQTPVVQFIA